MFKRLLLVIVLAIIGSCVQSEPKSADKTTCDIEYEKNRETQMPIPVNKLYIDTKISDDDVQATLMAAENWAVTMGQDMFLNIIITDKKIDRSECGSVWLTYGELPTSPSTGKQALGFTSWQSCSAIIFIEPDMLPRDANRVIMHELGHSMNLRHESEETSLMFNLYKRDIDQFITKKSICLLTHALDHDPGHQKSVKSLEVMEME